MIDGVPIILGLLILMLNTAVIIGFVRPNERRTVVTYKGRRSM